LNFCPGKKSLRWAPLKLFGSAEFDHPRPHLFRLANHPIEMGTIDAKRSVTIAIVHATQRDAISRFARSKKGNGQRAT
jgi:hypothetical protein